MKPYACSFGYVPGGHGWVVYKLGAAYHWVGRGPLGEEKGVAWHPAIASDLASEAAARRARVPRLAA